MRVRYGRWTGTQDPFPSQVSADDVLEQVADDLLGGRTPDEALRRLLARGLTGRQRAAGLSELRRRVEQARRRELERMGLEGPLRAISDALEEIVGTERAALDLSADPEVAADRHAHLDALPDDVAGRLAALRGYDWYDERAAQAFAELLDRLRGDVAEATFGRLAGVLEAMGPEDAARLRDLLAELNALAARQERGEDVSDDFARFKQRYGDLLPDDPDTLDDLLAELARRTAAMSQLFAGLEPDQREQLAQLAAGLLGDLGLQAQAAELQRRLAGRFPELGWSQGVPGAMPSGGQDGDLAATVDWVEHLQAYDDLAKALGQDYPGARLEDVDADALRRLLGDEAHRDLQALREVERELERAGVAARSGGRLQLTPRGVLRLGERSLAHIYEQVVGGTAGSHEARSAGGDGELTGATRPLRFGDPFRLDVGRTVGNAILRGGAGGGSAGAAGGVQLVADDFELAEAERRVRAATVLLLDMSFSMPLRGNWLPAKRVALALHALISGRFPEDRFYVVGFSDYARRLQPRELLSTGWERVYGTNMQHAFMLARRLLAADPDAEPQVIMVTDGEPTAHLEGDVPLFAWPPERRTLELTLAEAARLTRRGATLNVFLLDHDPGAAAFVERMVSACGGRIFYPRLDDLGSLVVQDFLRGRRRS